MQTGGRAFETRTRTGDYTRRPWRDALARELVQRSPESFSGVDLRDRSAVQSRVSEILNTERQVRRADRSSRSWKDALNDPGSIVEDVLDTEIPGTEFLGIGRDASDVLGRTKPERATIGESALEATTAIGGAGAGLRAGARVAPKVQGAKDTAQGARAAYKATKALGGGSAVKGAQRGLKAAQVGGKVAGKAKQTAQAAKAKPVQTGWRVTKGTAKGTVRVASFPIRRPIKTTKYSFAAQAPLAATSGDPVDEAKKVLEGKGVAAGALRSAGQFVGDAVPNEVAGNFVKDIFDLPANTPPAIYMPLAGAVEAAQGNPDRLEKLWEAYKESGFLPAVVRGDAPGALKAAKEHPLYAGLEASAVGAVAGRTGGAVARGTTGGRVASRQREPLQVPGGQSMPRRYSPDLFRQGAQRLADRRRQKREGGQIASTRPSMLRPPSEAGRIANERIDTIVAAEEGLRRANRTEQMRGGLDVLKGVGLRRRAGVSRDLGVSLATQGILRSPKTWAKDIDNYAKTLDRSHTEMQAALINAPNRAARADIRAQIKANRAVRKDLDKLRKADPEPTFQAGRESGQALRRSDREKVEAMGVDEAQLRQAAAIPFARAHMGAGYGKPTKGLGRRATEQEAGKRLKTARQESERVIDSEGRALGYERIEAEMRRQGVDPETVGFVSQSPSARGPGSFYRAFFPNKQSFAGPKRTGEATAKGTADFSYEALVEQRVRGQGMVDAAQGFQRSIADTAVPGVRYATRQEADRAVARVSEQEGIPLTPVRLTPVRATQREGRHMEEFFDQLDPNNQNVLVDATLRDMLSDSVRGSGPGPYVLVPQQAVKRLGEHFKPAGDLRKTAQVISSAFKGAVLPTSPNWFLGNVVDINMRTALEGTTPYGMNAYLGRRLLREMEKLDPVQAKRARAVLVPGAMFSSAKANRVFRDARQFAGSALGPLAQKMGTLRRTPGPKQIVDAYTAYRDAAFQFNGRFLENQSFYAMLGKAARSDVRATTGQWHKAMKLGDDAVRDLAEGLLGTPKQIQYAKQIEGALGQWSRNSPGARAVLVDYAPFAMWTRAAMKYVFWTLPTQHPIKTGIAAIAMEMTEEERKAFGLSMFAEKGERLPQNLMGSIPLNGGRLLAPQTITSFGYAGDPFRNLATGLLPQYDLATLEGLDFTGRRITHKDGTPVDNPAEIAGLFLLSQGEAMIPFLSMGRRISDKGPIGAVPRTLRPYDEGLVEYLRHQSGGRSISVPAKGSGGEGSSSSSSGGWRSGGSSSSSSGGWRD